MNWNKNGLVRPQLVHADILLELCQAEDDFPGYFNQYSAGIFLDPHEIVGDMHGQLRKLSEAADEHLYTRDLGRFKECCRKTFMAAVTAIASVTKLQDLQRDCEEDEDEDEDEDDPDNEPAACVACQDEGYIMTGTYASGRNIESLCGCVLGDRALANQMRKDFLVKNSTEEDAPEDAPEDDPTACEACQGKGYITTGTYPNGSAVEAPCSCEAGDNMQYRMRQKECSSDRRCVDKKPDVSRDKRECGADTAASCQLCMDQGFVLVGTGLIRDAIKRSCSCKAGTARTVNKIRERVLELMTKRQTLLKFLFPVEKKKRPVPSRAPSEGYADFQQNLYDAKVEFAESCGWEELGLSGAGDPKTVWVRGSHSLDDLDAVVAICATER